MTIEPATDLQNRIDISKQSIHERNGESEGNVRVLDLSELSHNPQGRVCSE